jgi:hypothetical protein
MVKKVEAKMPQTFLLPAWRGVEGGVTGVFPCVSEGVDSWGGKEESSTGFPNSLVFFRFLSFSQILVEISRMLSPIGEGITLLGLTAVPAVIKHSRDTALPCPYHRGIRICLSQQRISLEPRKLVI